MYVDIERAQSLSTQGTTSRHNLFPGKSKLGTPIISTKAVSTTPRNLSSALTTRQSVPAVFVQSKDDISQSVANESIPVKPSKMIPVSRDRKLIKGTLFSIEKMCTHKMAKPLLMKLPRKLLGNELPATSARPIKSETKEYS